MNRPAEAPAAEPTAVVPSAVAVRGLIEGFRTYGAGPWCFDGLSEEDLNGILHPLEWRRFPEGATVLAEGDSPRHICIIQSGTAEIFVRDRHGVVHRVSEVGPGTTVGEMSVFTGQPVSATVRASSDLDVLILGETDFYRAANTFPQIYRNLGAMLSQRLSRANRLALGETTRPATPLVDYGAPPLLGYALASSLAWHTRAAVLLVVVSREDLPEELARYAALHPGPPLPLQQVSRRGVTPGASRGIPAQVSHLRLSEGWEWATLSLIVDELRELFDFVLVQASAADGDRLLAELESRSVRLAGLHLPLPADESGRPGHTIRAWVQGGTQDRPDGRGVLHVPSLGGEDEAALREGLLPGRTAAGRSLGWAARDLAGLKIGLALGGGAQKGYGHVGVYQVLRRIQLPIDYLAGTSIGAAVASLIALGYSPAQIADTLDRVGESLFRLRIPTKGILSQTGLRARLRAMAGNMGIEELPLPVALTATDFVSQQEVVFRSGPIWQAVLASTCLPAVFEPNRIGPRLLVDGGLIEPVPTHACAALGANVVIAVRLVSGHADSRDHGLAGQDEAPSVLQAMTRTIDIMQNKISTDTAGAAQILIPVRFENRMGWGLRNFSRGRAFIELGRKAAEEALPRLSAALPWLRT